MVVDERLRRTYTLSVEYSVFSGRVESFVLVSGDLISSVLVTEKERGKKGSVVVQDV